jgi:hypothetical protein
VAFGPKSRVEWRRATREQLYDFLRSPALYGTYRYSARALVPVDPEETARKERVRRRNHRRKLGRRRK